MNNKNNRNNNRDNQNNNLQNNNQNSNLQNNKNDNQNNNKNNIKTTQNQESAVCQRGVSAPKYALTIVNGYLSELDSKTLLLKTPHI